ncbi:carotenoid biosynthesis protein [Nocardioides zeae]|uniref:Membrane protein n=1 Tax=Nocardioides zeae TaxID=1457234 RepID=A0AAJ1TYV2_9ACTN|nr:carotenoid biosynthesis protein [Nocardioides zeae]MDQ1104881.1 putative membrane protein [Nocardioides zeae]
MTSTSEPFAVVPRRAHRGGRAVAPHRWPALVLAAGGVLAQMAFPFTDGGTLGLTTASVVLLAAAALADAWATRGPLAAATLAAVAGLGGLVAEAVGVRTGFPFGDYAYTGTLGLEVLGVPALVPLAWIMMAWPALAVARRLGGERRWAVALVGAAALTAWDVFLDPQMVDQGHWTWAHPSPGLPGIDDVPLTNYAGWLLVSFLMVAALDRLVPRTSPDQATGPAGRGSRDIALDAVPLAVYLWTYSSSVLAHAVFFGRPPVALVGGLLMGLVAVPLVVRLLREQPGGRRALQRTGQRTGRDSGVGPR